jgi:hypothetical protein
MADDPLLEPDSGEPPFDLRRGLKILIIVGTIVTIISVICLSLDSRY